MVDYDSTFEAFIAMFEQMRDDLDYSWSNEIIEEEYPGALAFVNSLKAAREVFILSENAYADVWTIQDVVGVAPDLTEDECREVLKRAFRNLNRDRDWGMSWSVLEMEASEFRDLRDEEKV